MTPIYKVIANENLTNNDRNTVAQLLAKQNKVTGNLYLKADRCKEICIAYINDLPIAIGGIKRKTGADFGAEKANLIAMEKEFDWELGYIYTEEDHCGKGISSEVVKKLLEFNRNQNLMASTEILKNPAMVHILEKNGFIRKGNPWKSEIHQNELGLFLRLKAPVNN